jgi:hypothetical protein
MNVVYGITGPKSVSSLSVSLSLLLFWTFPLYSRGTPSSTSPLYVLVWDTLIVVSALCARVVLPVCRSRAPHRWWMRPRPRPSRA